MRSYFLLMIVSFVGLGTGCGGKSSGKKTPLPVEETKDRNTGTGTTTLTFDEVLPQILLAKNTKDCEPFADLLKGKKSLALNHRNLSDLSFLVCFPELVTLSLRDNALIDISPLESLAALEELDLSYNDIEDLSSLRNLTQLRYLDASANALINVPAEDFDKLTTLDLSFSRKAVIYDFRYHSSN